MLEVNDLITCGTTIYKIIKFEGNGMAWVSTEALDGTWINAGLCTDFKYYKKVATDKDFFKEVIKL